MKKKSYVPWILCLALPIPLLVLTSFLQLIVRAFLTGEGETSGEAITTVVNIVSLLIGMGAVIMLLLFPLWIIRLVRVSKYNKGLQAPQNPMPTEPPSAPTTLDTQESNQTPPQPPTNPQL